MAQKYDKDLLFEKTNAGLDYIHQVYPNSVGFENKNRNFKLDDNDDTPSGRIKNKNGIWYVYNYREDNTGRNAIDLCSYLHGFDFAEAVKHLYELFKLDTADGYAAVTAKWLIEDTQHDENFWHVEVLPEHTKLDVFAPFLDSFTANEYNFKSISFYQFVGYKTDKNTGKKTTQKQLYTVNATVDYPIFAFVEDGFAKTYEPFAKKEYRFKYLGSKPSDFIFGWDRLVNKVNVDQITYLRKKVKDFGNSTSEAAKEARKELNEELLDEIIIASGGSDGLNAASLDNNMIWPNSETQQIEFKQYQFLKLISKAVYNMPDIDVTGVKMARQLGLKYLDIKTIWLPLNYELTKKKDFRDWIGIHKTDGIERLKASFAKLKKVALEFRWWKFNKSSRSGYQYNFVSLMYFLEHNGFYVYKLEHKNAQKGKIEQIFIKIDGHVVREVHPSEIKVFLQDWLRENKINLDVLNMVIGSQGVNEKQLLSLPRKQLDFKVATKQDQLFFFQNHTIRVTAAGIEVVRGDITSHIWEEKIVKHKIILGKQPQFNIFKDASGAWDITVNEKNNNFFNYLINSSRVHWRKELEEPFGNDLNAKEAYHAANRFNIAGPNLNPEAWQEQKQHLINKIYAFGYMLHSYKDEAKPWILTIVDNKIPDATYESKGGSGKSLGISKILDNLKNRVVLKGRDPRLTDNQFIYDEVSEETDVIFIDDAHYSLNFGFFYSEATGSTKVNKKHGLQFEIQYAQSPKMVISSNFVPHNLDESSTRRMFLAIYGDYYHQKSEDYLETRKPTDDFGGRNMLSDSSNFEEWNLFYNFCLQCLQFYLSCPERVEAPDGNIKLRDLNQQMGDNFKEWANSYFSTEEDMSANVNEFVPRKDMQEDCRKFLGSNFKSPNAFKKALTAYCKLHGWVLNPKELQGSDGTIKRAITDNATGKRTMPEFFYINTTGTPVYKDDAPQLQPAPQAEEQSLYDYDNDDAADIDGLKY